MRIASNKLSDMISYYHTELESVFDKGEISALLEMAIEHYLGYSRTEIITKAENNINQSAVIKLYDCCKDLKKNIPIQYILGEAWFYGLKFNVGESVLIPRPETEELVKLILDENKLAQSCLDIGTGSGCIAIALKKNMPATKVSACDISADALVTAGMNAVKNKVDVSFFEADALSTENFSKKFGSTFDVIVSNPPYIKLSEKSTMQQQVLAHEPHLALFTGDEDATIFYKKIIGFCDVSLNKKGSLYFELNPITAEEVKNYAITSGLFAEVNLIKDMSGKQRFLKAIKH